MKALTGQEPHWKAVLRCRLGRDDAYDSGSRGECHINDQICEGIGLALNLAAFECNSIILCVGNDELFHISSF